MNGMTQFRTAPNGDKYRLIDFVFDPLRGNVWVLVEVAGKIRPRVLSVVQWKAATKDPVNSNLEAVDGAA